MNLLALTAYSNLDDEKVKTEDFDVCWVDGPVPPEALAKLKPYQRMSQFPGIQAICNKNKLARNLQKMKRSHPEEYEFFP